MFYVYKFLDAEGNALYVGQTIDIDRRMQEHVGTIWDKEKDHIEFAECKTLSDMNLYEMYYINKLHAKYNTALVFKDEPSFELPDLQWSIYTKDIYLIAHQERCNQMKENMKVFSPDNYWKNKKENLEMLIQRKIDENIAYKESEEYKLDQLKLQNCENKINDIR